MNKYLFTTVLIAATVTGCSRSPESSVKDIVISRLVDPDSAKFGAITPGVDGKHYCGMVNAKNRMGGFTGMQPFVAELSNKTEGTVQFIQDSPQSIDFKWLRDSEGSYTKKYGELFEKCLSIDTWNQFCRPTLEIHHLCHVMLGGNSKEFIDKLFKLR